MKNCFCGINSGVVEKNEACGFYFCDNAECFKAALHNHTGQKAPAMIVRGGNRTNKKMSAVTEKYIKSRYRGPDGHVKCDPRYKPSEHYLGS